MPTFKRNLLQNKKTNQEVVRMSFLSVPSKTPTLQQAWFTGKNWDYWFYRKEPTFIIMDEVKIFFFHDIH